MDREALFFVNVACVAEMPTGHTTCRPLNIVRPSVLNTARSLSEDSFLETKTATQ